MAAREPIDPRAIKELLGSSFSADPWFAGLTVVTRSGERIEAISTHLADDESAVVCGPEGERSLPLAEITQVLIKLRSAGPE